MKFFERLFKFFECVEITHIPPADIVEPSLKEEESSLEIKTHPPAALLEDAIAELQAAMQKLGRTQFRANAVAESNRKEIKQMLQHAVALWMEPQKETLQELLLVVDGLEEGIRAIEQVNDEHTVAPAWADGFRMVHDRLLTTLKKWDVTPVDSVGQPFSPHVHRAVDTVYTNEVAGNTVVEEQRRGYLCGQQVLRYAEVVVARKKEDRE